MNIALFPIAAVVLVAYMTLVFLIAKQYNRIAFVDVAWAIGFVVLAALVAGLELSERTLLIVVLVNFWAIRLAQHLINRLQRKKGEDPRYEAIASKWSKKYYWLRAYLSIFLLQGVLVLIVGLPIIMASGDSHNFASVLAITGGVVWGLGFIYELIADKQLETFLGNDKNKGKLLETGLWRYSRHPNYFGELVQWYGIAIIASGAVWGWVGFIGPIVLTILIRYVSGVPPIENRKKQDKTYQAYMSRTNALIPKLQR